MAQHFEEELEWVTGAGRVLVLSSGTAALHLGLDLLGVGPGDGVALPTMTFSATADAALYLGATVRLADVDPATLNISAASLEPVMNGAVRAVVPSISVDCLIPSARFATLPQRLAQMSLWMQLIPWLFPVWVAGRVERRSGGIQLLCRETNYDRRRGSTGD